MTTDSNKIVFDIENNIDIGDSAIVSGFTGKHSFYNARNYYDALRKYLGFGYGFGCIKYWPYSWQEDPENSFAMPDVNFDAAMRHVTLIRTGFINDLDVGYSHLPAVLTRIGMAIGVWYHYALYGTCRNPRVNNMGRVIGAVSDLAGHAVCLHTSGAKIREALNLSNYHIISFLKTIGAESTGDGPNILHAILSNAPEHSYDAVVAYFLDLLTTIHATEILPAWDVNNPRKLFGFEIDDTDTTVQDVTHAVCQKVTWLDVMFAVAILLVEYIDREKLSKYGYLSDDDMADKLQECQEAFEKKKTLKPKG